MFNEWFWLRNENRLAPPDLHCLKQLPRLWEFKERNSESSRNKWFLVIATFSTKQKGWVGIAEWTQPCRTDAHPDSATQSTSSVTCFPSVFCSVKSLFKCRDLTGTSENCFPWSAYPIIMTTVSKEKLISYEKWQSSNKMWPWIQMYLSWGKKCPFHSVTQILA